MENCIPKKSYIVLRNLNFRAPLRKEMLFVDVEGMKLLLYTR